MVVPPRRHPRDHVCMSSIAATYCAAVMTPADRRRASRSSVRGRLGDVAAEAARTNARRRARSPTDITVAERVVDRHVERAASSSGSHVVAERLEQRAVRSTAATQSACEAPTVAAARCGTRCAAGRRVGADLVDVRPRRRRARCTDRRCPGPATASSTAAVSRTVRVSTNSCVSGPQYSPKSGPSVVRAAGRLEPDDAAHRTRGSGSTRPCRCRARRARCPPRPRRPTRRSSRRCCGRGPTGCGSRRRRAARS